MEDETTHLKNGNVGVAAVEDSKVHFTCSKQMSKLTLTFTWRPHKLHAIGGLDLVLDLPDEAVRQHSFP